MSNQNAALTDVSILYKEHAKKVPALRILAVDDHQSSRMMISYILGGSHHIINPCHGPTKALDLAAEKDYNLFILDIHMPGMSGSELLEYLRKSREIYANTPAILMSADHSPSLSHLANQVPNTLFISKPITVYSILTAIETLYSKA